MMFGSGGHGVFIFGIELVAMNPAPANPQNVTATNGELAGLNHKIHRIGGNILISTIILHAVGTIKHHLIDKNNKLYRMLGE